MCRSYPNLKVSDMKNWRKAILNLNASIREAIEIIDTSSLLIAIIVDDNDKLLGIITDGDIRKAIINGVSFDNSVEAIMNHTPLTVSNKDDSKQVNRIFEKYRFRHLPIVNERNEIEGLHMINEIQQTVKNENIVVLMAGGFGTRLGELTQDCPKPLLKVGGKPILETIIENFIEFGFYKFFVTVNYKADMIKEYFGDGSQWDVDIQYIEEKDRLGTAGALSLLKIDTELPIIVMNGDLLTKVNFQLLLDYHKEQNAEGTMGVREYDFQVPFGVVNMKGQKIENIDEKPVHRFFVNAGIYVLSPRMVKLIPKNECYDMPSLFNEIVSLKYRTTAFPIHEYWLDIGRQADFERANGDYSKIFPKIV